MVLFSIIISLFASYLLYLGWRKKNKTYSALGWLSLLLSTYFYCVSVGIEFGLIFSFAFLSIFVWLWILKEQKHQTLKKINKPHSHLKWHLRGSLRHIAWGIYHLIFLLFISSAITIALVDLLPYEKSTEIAIGIITIPIIWALLSYYQLASTKKWQSLTITLLGSTASAIYLFVY